MSVGLTPMFGVKATVRETPVESLTRLELEAIDGLVRATGRRFIEASALVRPTGAM